MKNKEIAELVGIHPRSIWHRKKKGIDLFAPRMDHREAGKKGKVASPWSKRPAVRK